MDFKRALIPAVAGILFFVGCEKKAKNLIPTQVPAVVKAGEEQRILEWMRYIGVRRDVKAVSAISISGVDPQVAGFGNYWHLHREAGAMGVALTDAEITAFGLVDLKNLGILAPGVSKKELNDALNKVAQKQIPALPNEMVALSETKLDEMPLPTDKTREVEWSVVKGLQGPVGDAGVFRIAAAVPEAVWNALTIQQVKPQKDPAFVDVFVQMQTKLVLQLTLAKRKDGNMGVVYAKFSTGAGTFRKWEEALKAGQEITAK